MNPLQIRVPFISKLKAKVQHLTTQLQHMSAVIFTSESANTNVGNLYKTAKAQIESLSKKYEAKDDWGNQITKNVIHVRTSFIIGSGITVTLKPENSSVLVSPSPIPNHNSSSNTITPSQNKEGERELKFIKDMIEKNNLDEELPLNFAREAEIEGRFLCQLIPDLDNETIRVHWIPWTQHSYEVHTKPGDYSIYTKVTWKTNNESSSQREITLFPPEFVYATFGGRTHKVNDCPPHLGALLKQFEDLDKALYDYRKINHLFASPTPWFNCASKNVVKELDKRFQAVNWKIGKLLSTFGVDDFQMVSSDITGVTSIKEEISTTGKIISGGTGVPVQFLGMPDLLSNRATAENLLELITASTGRERRIWVGTYEEIFKKAIEMANDLLPGHAGMDPDAVKIDIPFTSQSKLTELVEVWLPLYEARTITLETFLSKIPEIDLEKEKANLAEMVANEIETMNLLPSPPEEGTSND